ncbi:MAG: dihydropteroate synthase [Bacteroidales bacterium]|nr:dihydropteroate synthase [Bacteroidales bacterium]
MDANLKIMGIVNINHDSFYCGSRVSGVRQFNARVRKLIAGGADAIDIGACSSRPGSEYPGVAEEWRRLEPVLRAVRRYFPGQLISIDTFSADIVQRAFDIIGPFMVNDITAGQSDPELLPLVSRLGLQYIAMHNQNPPAIEGKEIRRLSDGEGDIVARVAGFFRNFEKRAAEAGLNDWILDPGFGFGKDVDENLELLDRLDELKVFGREILAGISRKRMTYQRQGTKPEDDETLAETRRLQDIAVERGATWLRVHDVGGITPGRACAMN